MMEIEVGGLRIAYERAGEGPPLVLVHGYVGDGKGTWQRQIDALSDEFTVMAWDGPGAGQSSDPPESFRMPDYADCLAGFIEALELERPHVGGLSFGGGLAIDRWPTRRRGAPRVDTRIEAGRLARRRPHQHRRRSGPFQRRGARVPSFGGRMFRHDGVRCSKLHKALKHDADDLQRTDAQWSGHVVAAVLPTRQNPKNHPRLIAQTFGLSKRHAKIRRSEGDLRPLAIYGHTYSHGDD